MPSFKSVERIFVGISSWQNSMHFGTDPESQVANFRDVFVVSSNY
jgi:hypothetical protein